MTCKYAPNAQEGRQKYDYVVERIPRRESDPMKHLEMKSIKVDTINTVEEINELDTAKGKVS